MKLYILNAAVLPQDGKYSRISLDINEAAEMLHQATEIVSSVAYPEVCSLIYEFSGVTVPLDTEKKLTVLEENECTLLVVKLRFRIKAERKGVERHKDINEYEFVRIDYVRK